MKKVLIFICCICFISCNKKEPSVNQQRGSNIIVNNRIIENFPNSLSEEKYLSAYKNFVFLLQDKHNFIEKNFDFQEGIRKKYKQNEVFACNTKFVNNELLTDSPVKIGMTKDDVYNFFNFPEQSIQKENTEVIDYSYSMYVSRNMESEEKFYASTTVEFFFDENKIITEIFLVAEEIEAPVEEDDWY